jgi:hypothetical protein
MSREADFALRMATDATLMAILLGGVWTPSGYILPPAIVVGHIAGLEGISRDATPAAFSGGYLLPTSLVKQRANVPTGDIEDYNDLTTSARQIVEIWLYCDQASGYTPLDLAAARLYVLFQGYVMSDSFEVRLANVLDRQRDDASLSGASLVRQDWQVDNIIR